MRWTHREYPDAAGLPGNGLSTVTLEGRVITFVHKTSHCQPKRTTVPTVIIPMSMVPMIFNLPALPFRRQRWIAWTVRLLLWLVVAAWLLFGLSVLVLHGWIVPRIGDFRPRLEIVASRALGVPVRIGRITARSQGMIPTFELSDVTLLDAQGREALRLPRVLGAVSPSSLWGLGFEQLYIDKPDLDIRRGADGKIYVGGLDVSRSQDTSHSAAPDWFFSQIEFVIHDGTAHWTDELHPAPPLALTHVDLVMRNSRHRHLMRLDATPPVEWGERFTLRGIFKSPLWSIKAGDFAAWTGELYAEFGRADMSRIMQYVNIETLGAELMRGHGTLRAWAEVNKGRISGGTADVALRDLDIRLGARLEPLAFESMAGRIGGAQHANGFDFSTEGLRFRTRDGLQWPGGNVALAHTRDQAGAPQHSELKADRLDLAALAQIANRLPLDPATHALIASFAPRGLMQTVEAQWQGPLDAPISYAAKGRVAGLSIVALPSTLAGGGTTHEAPGRPGVSGADLDFDFTQEGGKARVNINQGALDLPGIFEEPRLALDRLSVDAQWKLSGRRIEAQLRNLQFANADAQGQAQISWHTTEVAAGPSVAGSLSDRRFPGVLDLQGTLSRGDGTRVHRYLPLVLPSEVRHYVRDAVTRGQVSDVKFRVKGALGQLPFKNPAQGDFRVSAKMHNVHFAYVPKSLQPPGTAPWPALADLNGELAFNRSAMEISGASANVAGLPGLQLTKANARIADLTQGATVEVTTELKGLLSDALNFVNTSPVGGMTRQMLARTAVTGMGDYRFRLNLPIHSIDKSQVVGTVTLPGNDVRFAPGTPQLTKLKGVVSVNERGFSVAGAQAGLFGGDIRFDGGMRAPPTPAGGGSVADNPVTFRGQGTLTAEGLRQARDFGLVSRIAQNATGGAAYTAALTFRRGVSEIAVSSNLQGMALNLPAPLNKTAESALPLHFENALLPASMSPGQTLQDRLSVSIGRVATINYVRDVSGAEAHAIRGSIGVGLEAGETGPAVETGVAANINLAQVDLDAWEKILSAGPATSISQSAPLGPPVVTESPSSTAQSYLPTVMAIRAKDLLVQGRRLHNVVVGGSRDGLNWRANVDATELNGYLEFRQAGDAGATRLYARLSRLNLAPGTASEVEAILDEQPASIPALDIVVGDMELRGRKLGRVEIEAVNRGAAASDGVREWRLNKFNVIVPEAVLTATGNWVAMNPRVDSSPAAGPGTAQGPAERRRTVLNFTLDIANSGELLKRFGQGELVRRGKGKLEGQIAWIGSPLSLDYPTLSGQFNVNIESGQFVKADPGIAKLLGVLSLQSLPRRLTLDFRDVFSEGFAFDFVRGDVTIRQGLATTNNLQMSGVNAAVLMEGSADIAHETQNLKVIVVPEINAGTASLIATVINPAIGLGTFLAQMFLRKPLIEAATQEFHIDGTWSDPRIIKIDRKAAARSRTGDTPVETR